MNQNKTEQKNPQVNSTFNRSVSLQLTYFQNLTNKKWLLTKLPSHRNVQDCVDKSTRAQSFTHTREGRLRLRPLPLVHRRILCLHPLARSARLHSTSTLNFIFTVECRKLDVRNPENVEINLDRD